MSTFGIEKIGVYPGTMALDISALCAARGTDYELIEKTLMTVQRSVSPAWEDTVTMSVNAASGLLEPGELETVELLISATESSVDQEKPISSWVHRWLGLPSHARNFEMKHACYAGTGAMRMGLAWLADQEPDRPCRVLITGADASLLGFGEPYEPVMGACGFAIVLSNDPAFLEIERQSYGVFASEVTDVIRPALTVETGNSETSLLAYMEALEGAWTDYTRRQPDADFENDFARHLYHLPFAGMGRQAHRALASAALEMDRKAATADFAAKVEPSIRYSRRIGSSYSASTFIAALSLLDHDDGVGPGDPVSVFSYGSGSCAEFYRARFGPQARAIAREEGLGTKLDQRRALDVAEYEASESARVGAMGTSDYQPDHGLVSGWFEEAYEGSNRLVLDRIEGYERVYRRA
ncbi:MAG: hydroxymethylglutaryl-CoA synthase [Pseudomonadota bacterium]